ncbi:alpha-galactosidase [Bacillus sp. Cs-700]|uniref:alpha-galactosidase n=1 Tax=Bacillus sp. Cs-700 TaxID=2589818 RepID=UPI0014095165|nr:alpha-galactosidase [Bacillus sp. Cs-700]
MPVFINEENLQFHLQGKELSYVFHVMKNGQLGQLYFGKKLRDRADFSHLSKKEARVASSYVYEDDPTFSLDLIKQEYPGYGTSDYREPAFQIEHPDGSRISNFTYQSYELVKGKPSLSGLPATYVEDESEADTLVIHLHDSSMNLSLSLMYSVYHERNVMIRSAAFTNKGDRDHVIKRAHSASVDFPDADFGMMQLSGSWSRERHVHERQLSPGLQSIQSTRGTSSAQHNPFLALKRPMTTEHAGEVYGFSFVYSGNFQAQVEVDHYETARVTMGINPFDFSWVLQSGETFQTPEVVMAYSKHGLNDLSQTYHDLYRSRLARGKWRDAERPVLLNNWEATYFDFNEEKLLSIAKQAKETGVELFVLDDGWFGKRNDDRSSLGDWFVDSTKLPKGLSSLASKMSDLGLLFGLWFEPEMVSKESELYKKHPEWVIQVPGRSKSVGRHQLVLDFSNPKVVDYIYEQMATILKEANIDYVKWDMNRYMTEIGSLSLMKNQQAEVPHRYILGVYALYERLIESFPHVLFESCASGGARFDPGMLYYAPQAWTSDDTDAVERLSIQYGTSMVYPISSMGAHVSAVPNHQVKRITSLETRANVAYFGAFGYELDVTKMSDAELTTMTEQINWYKENRALLQYGTFYRLISPFDGKGNVTSWMSVSADRKKAIVGYYQVLAEANPSFKRLYVKGLDPEKEYEVSGYERTYYGDELMSAGIQLPGEYDGSQTGGLEESGDFSSYVFVISEHNDRGEAR